MRWTQYFYVAIILLGIFIFTYTFYQIVVVGANPDNGILSPFDKSSCDDSDLTIKKGEDSYLISSSVTSVKNKEDGIDQDSCKDNDKLIEQYCNKNSVANQIISCSKTFGDTYRCIDGKCISPCGDGTIQSGEECDDGNSNDGDGCSSICQEEFCGDSVIQEGLGEQCDDGNTNGGDGCGPLCYTESCGDDVVQGSEECDDGNNENGDGCSSSCNIESTP